MSQGPTIYEAAAGVATITLNRPEKLNALTRPLLLGVKAGIARAISEGQRCIVLTGAGRGFSAGQDLGDMSEDDSPRPDVETLLKEWYYPLLRDIRECTVPVIAAVNGVAAGAGMALSLACDMRVASDAARFTTAFTKIGLVPDAGMGFTLPRLVGQSRAMRLVIRSEMIAAAEALELGLVDEVVPAERFQARLEEFSRELAAGPTRAYVLSRRLLYAGTVLPFEEFLELEARTQAEATATEDNRAAVAAFLEKRPPSFQGR